MRYQQLLLFLPFIRISKNASSELPQKTEVQNKSENLSFYRKHPYIPTLLMQELNISKEKIKPNSNFFIISPLFNYLALIITL